MKSLASPRAWLAIIATSILCMAALGAVMYATTNKGRITIIANDPNLLVTVDRHETLKAERLRDPLTLDVGQHELKAERGDMVVMTKAFSVRRGENEPLRLDFGPPAESRSEIEPSAPAVATAPSEPRSVLAPETLTFHQGVNGYEGESGRCYFPPDRHERPENQCLWADWPDPESTNINQSGSVSVLRFDDLFGREPGQIPPGSKIIKASLQVVTGQSAPARGHGARVHRLKKPVDFKDVMKTLMREADVARSEFLAPLTTWAGDPTLKRLIEAGPVELDVTADIQAWSSGAPNHGWAFIPWPNGKDGWGFMKPDCKEIAIRPFLSVSFLPPR